jgi:hypothetical protein
VIAGLLSGIRLFHDAVATAEGIQHQMMYAYVMIANDELGGTWEEAVVAYFKITD